MQLCLVIYSHIYIRIIYCYCNYAIRPKFNVRLYRGARKEALGVKQIKFLFDDDFRDGDVIFLYKWG